VNTIDWRNITNYRPNAFIVRDNNANCGKFVTVLFAVSDAVAQFQAVTQMTGWKGKCL